jgi:hypothetical protein
MPELLHSFDHGGSLRERIDYRPAMHATDLMEPERHGRHHAEVSAATLQRPHEFLVIRGASDDHSPVGENDFRVDQVVGRKAEASDERAIAPAEGEPAHPDRAARAIAPAEGEPAHPDRAARAGHGDEPPRVELRGEIAGEGTSAHPHRCRVLGDSHLTHLRQIDQIPSQSARPAQSCPPPFTERGSVPARAARTAALTSSEERHRTSAFGRLSERVQILLARSYSACEGKITCSGSQLARSATARSPSIMRVLTPDQVTRLIEAAPGLCANSWRGTCGHQMNWKETCSRSEVLNCWTGGPVAPAARFRSR